MIFFNSPNFRQKKDYSMTKSLNLGHSVDANSLADMSKSLAGFHLTAAGGAGSKAMHESTMDQVGIGFYLFYSCSPWKTPMGIEFFLHIVKAT